MSDERENNKFECYQGRLGCQLVALNFIHKAGLQLSILACFNRSAVHSGTVYLVCKFFRNAHHNLCVMGRGNSCLTSLNLLKPK